MNSRLSCCYNFWLWVLVPFRLTHASGPPKQVFEILSFPLQVAHFDIFLHYSESEIINLSFYIRQ